MHGPSSKVCGVTRPVIDDDLQCPPPLSRNRIHEQSENIPGEVEL